jgi:glycosyltransferase involved in cell wall biosynthesis
MPVEPQLSVLIPCWNAEDTIEATLRSVLDERSVNLECVVVDDASTDSTAAVVEGIAVRDPRVVLVRLAENGGVSSARNIGLERVQGRWLTLIDADDQMVPGALARLVEVGVDRRARAVVGQQVWTDGRREWVSDYYDRPDIRVAGRTSLAARPGLVFYASPHGKLFARSCWDGLAFFGRVLGDQPWTIRALLRAGDDIEVLDETVYRWHRPGPGRPSRSITSTSRASARGSAEAVTVAEEALRMVNTEAERSIEDRDARRRFVAAYAERLIRSDLGEYLWAAVERGDPETGELITAIDGFVRQMPRGSMVRTPVLIESLLEPPLTAWRELDAPARTAYRSLVLAVREASPSAGQRESRVVRAALRVVDPGAGSRVDDVALLGLRARGRLRDIRRHLPPPIRGAARTMRQSARRAVRALRTAQPHRPSLS